MCKKLSILFVLIFFALPLIAQIKVTGTVTDANKSPLPGASILVKGSNHGVSSDLDGKYEIQVKQGDVLEFSFVGYQTQSRKISAAGGG